MQDLLFAGPPQDLNGEHHFPLAVADASLHKAHGVFDTVVTRILQIFRKLLYVLQ